MAYGVQLFDAKSNELVGRFAPAFIAAFITSPDSGSLSFPVLEGKTLVADPQNFFTTGGAKGKTPATASVANNTIVSWSGISADQPLLVIYK